MSLKTDAQAGSSARPTPRLALNYMILSGAELVSKVLAALAFAYLARVLGPEHYGYVEFALAIVFFFTLAVDWGLSSYAAREIAKTPHLTQTLFVQVTLLRALLAAASIAVLAVLTALMPQPQAVKSLLWLYALTFVVLPGLIQWVFQGHDRMHFVALASLVRWLLFSFGIFWFIRGPQDYGRVPLVEGAAMLAAAVFLISAAHRSFGFTRTQVNLRQAFGLLRQSFPIGASELVWAVKVYFATVLLGFMIGGAEVGYFSAANRIVISLHAFVWLYFYNLLPAISRGSQDSLSGLHRLMSTSIKITTWPAVFLGICGTAFAGVGIPLLYGPDYHAAVPVFQVLIWLIPLTLLNGHYRYTLIGYSKQTLEFWAAAAGAAANIVLNLLLTPVYGVVGAAWAFVLSELVIWIVAYYSVRRTITAIPMLPHLRLPLLAGVILVGALYLLLPLNFWLGAGAAVLLYAILILVAQPELVTFLRSRVVRGQTF